MEPDSYWLGSVAVVGCYEGEGVNLMFHDRWEFCDLLIHSKKAKEETHNAFN